MTDKEIFGNSILKAIDNGYEKGSLGDNWALFKLQYNQHYAIIFDKDFAKAFWGEHIVDFFTGNNANPLSVFDQNKTVCSSWTYHLQKMVLEEEPLKYLERFLDD